MEERIHSIFDENNGNYGYRRIKLELKNRGFIELKVPGSFQIMDDIWRYSRIFFE
ncbi:hypothetical protein J2Y03_005571 [Neobacillus niacini]|nr:hypothetical protein [Neobacillus niacini]